MDTTSRFHIPIRILSQPVLDTFADLDTGAEVDTIDITVAKQYHLQQGELTAPLIEAIGRMEVLTHGVWNVPIRLRDSRGTVKEVIRACVGVEHAPGGSSVILSMTTMEDYHIHVATWRREWWFECDKRTFQIVSERNFRRATRNVAKVYVVRNISEQFLLGGEEEINGPVSGLEDLPAELLPWKDVFESSSASILPRTKETDHAIDLIEGQEPPYGPIYPLSQRELAQLREFLDENLANGRIRPSKSSAGAPILFVPKKDGSLRLCVDYRGLNKATIRNRYPLPLISEILDRAVGAQFFTKIDVKDAYYRIRIKEGDEWKTAFRTRYGHYEFLVMPFGLTNAPATFQNYMHLALRGLLDDFCVAYLDDILIFSKDRDTHLHHIGQVLERLRSAELYAKPSKCVFFQDQVEFLGYIVSAEGVSMDPSRVDTIVSWPEPTSYHDVQVFLGFCNFYRRFIKGYSGLVSPLTSLLKGSKNGKKPGSVVLGVPERQAFTALKVAFQSAPLLRHFDPDRYVRLETDASNWAMSGIASQQDDEGKWHPVAFWSRKFTGPELNYSIPDKELFAIVESFRHWRHYLEGSRFAVEVLSDHANLQTFMKQPKLNGRQARWCMYLAPFEFVIKHRPGKSNPADAPSRRPDYEGSLGTQTELLNPLQKKMESPRVQVFTIRHLTQRGPESVPDQGDLVYEEHPEDDSKESAGNSPVDNDLEYWEDPEDLEGPETPQEKALRERRAQYQLSTEQYIPRATVLNASSREQALEIGTAEDLKDLIVRLQEADPETQRIKSETLQNRQTRLQSAWTVHRDGTVRFRDRLYIPGSEGLRQELLHLYHDGTDAGHFGVGRTTELLQRKYHWIGMHTDVKKYVASCAICQGTVSRRHRPYGKLESLPIPTRPFKEVSMDFITGLPSVWHKGENVDAILVIVDRFTKYALFLPTSTTITSVELAKLFHTEVELRYGAPEGVVSDRGSVFTSQFWTDLCYYSKIQRRLSTAYHPQTDGQTERANQTLESYLRSFIDSQQ